jgi:hypothetical protein
VLSLGTTAAAAQHGEPDATLLVPNQA